jgi:hypothetical protein
MLLGTIFDKKASFTSLKLSKSGIAHTTSFYRTWSFIRFYKIVKGRTA